MENDNATRKLLEAITVASEALDKLANSDASSLETKICCLETTKKLNAILKDGLDLSKS